MFTELGRLFAPLAQLVQSISFTPRGSEVRILQGAQMVDIVQLVRTSDCGSEGRGFESHYSPKKMVLYPSGLRGCSAKALFISSNLIGTSTLPHRLTAGQVVLVHLMVVRIYLG